MALWHSPLPKVRQLKMLFFWLLNNFCGVFEVSVQQKQNHFVKELHLIHCLNVPTAFLNAFLQNAKPARIENVSRA